MAAMTPAQRFETRWQRAAERAYKDRLQFRRNADGIHVRVISPNNEYIVTIVNAVDLDATCECEGFIGGNLCKHVVGVFILLGILDRNGNPVA